jgi:CheY-like chemotaxis protein
MAFVSMSTRNWADKSILIAEDDVFSFVYLKEILSPTGINIILAQDGMKAFAECIKNPEISIVLMDIKLPVVNGLESTRLIKRYKPHVVIIAQTAFAMAEDYNRCISAGCDDYLAKPVLPEQLLFKLDQYINSTGATSFVHAKHNNE